MLHIFNTNRLDLAEARARRVVPAPPWTAAALGALAVAAFGLAGLRGLWWVIGSAALEETVFRAGLHEAALRALARRPGPTWRHAAMAINVGVAVLFAAAHALSQPAVLAAATVLPAGLIGLHYQRWRSTRTCVLLHALANLVWLAWLSSPGPALVPA